MLVTLTDVSKGFLDETILEKINMSINEGDKIGLMGVNGAGKTTLLNIIAGILPCDEGTVSKKSNLEIGYLQQNEALDDDNTLEEEIKSALERTYTVRRLMAEISAKMASADVGSDGYKRLESEYAALDNEYTALDGYTADTRINRVLTGLGFRDFDLKMKTSALSGGEKTRFGMAKILLRNPELLILDEPTNHLDFSMLAWLEDYIKSYKGAVLTVSHDRYFLDNIVSSIYEIEQKHIYKYKGGYSAFIKQKEERLRVLEKEYDKQQQELTAMRDYVSRNLARSSSSNSVGSRVKALEKMEIMQKPNPRPKDIHFKFDYDIEPHKTVLTVKDMGVHVGDRVTGKQLYDNISLEVLCGDKIAIVGKNGVGKSSFLKAIMKRISCSGTVRFGGNVKVAYFDQELRDLDLNDTVIEAVHKQFPTKTDFEIRSALGRLLIEDEAVFKRVRELSGANRAKVQFCIIMFKRANVLILDEPTNHLDYIAKEALDEALKQFTGTLITVSHDRYFLNTVPTKIIEMFPDGLEIYNGKYDYYLEHRKTVQPQVTEKQDSEQKATYIASKLNKADERKRRAKINALSKEIEALESEIEELKALSATEEIVTDYVKLGEVLEEIKQKEATLEEKEIEWLELAE